MSKTDCFATLGIFTLLIFIVFFCQCVYEERNPKANPTIYFSGEELRTTNNKVNPIKVTMTAYSPDKAQTQGNPFETASALIVTPQDLWELKYVAVSRDLREKYDIEWGDSIYIEFKVVDLMGETAQGEPITNQIDVFMRNKKSANWFGKQKDRKIIILKGDK